MSKKNKKWAVFGVLLMVGFSIVVSRHWRLSNFDQLGLTQLEKVKIDSEAGRLSGNSATAKGPLKHEQFSGLPPDRVPSNLTEKAEEPVYKVVHEIPPGFVVDSHSPKLMLAPNNQNTGKNNIENPVRENVNEPPQEVVYALNLDSNRKDEDNDPPIYNQITGPLPNAGLVRHNNLEQNP